MSKKVRCPECSGTGVYTSSTTNESWECQLCGGEQEVTVETANEATEGWSEYKDLVKNHIETEN